MFLPCYTDLIIASPEDTSSNKPTSPPAYTPATVPSTTTTVTSPPPTSYPSVLVGRPTSSLSETKPKIPPPVPPRGTPKAQRPAQTNGKGATIHLPTNGSLLHDLLCLSIKSDSLYTSESCLDDNEHFHRSFEKLHDLRYCRSFGEIGQPSTSRDVSKRTISLNEKHFHTCEERKKTKFMKQYSEGEPMNRKYFKGFKKKTVDDTEVSKSKYGRKVKTLRNMFDRTSASDETIPTYRKPKYNPNFIGGSSYVDRRYENIPRIVISPSYETVPHSYSPEKNFGHVVYYSKTPPFPDSSDLGDLV